MLKKSLSPDSVYVANDFLTDGVDLLHRFKLSFEKDFALKSRRFKCFIDLRMACECLLKAISAYYGDHSRDRKAVIMSVELYKHNVTRLGEEMSPYLSQNTWKNLKLFTEKMASLPIGLRYALDGYDFISARESEYYETVGDDAWMDSFYDVLCKLCDEVDEQISKHSGLISVSSIPIEKILGLDFNKYKK